MQDKVETVNLPVPERSVREPRMTDSLRSLPVDPETAHRLDYKTVCALRVFAANHGWKIVQQKESSDSFLVWRVA